MSAEQTGGPQPGAFHVGEWLVEPTLNRVSRGGERVQIELKVMDVLVCLARHAPEVVSKDLIIDTVWQTEFISVNTLTHAIGQLRRVFGDDARNPCYIETITKRGYRLMAPVEWTDSEENGPPLASPVYAIVADGHEFLLCHDENVLGRSVDAVVRIDGAAVSRRHARILLTSHGAVLEDLGSKNGTRLWGERIALPTPLRNGDEINIGSKLLVFRLLTADSATQTAVDDH